MLGKVGVPWTGFKVIDVAGLVELPDQEAYQQAAVVVVALVPYIEDLELAFLVLSLE